MAEGETYDLRFIRADRPEIWTKTHAFKCFTVWNLNEKIKCAFPCSRSTEEAKIESAWLSRSRVAVGLLPEPK